MGGLVGIKPNTSRATILRADHYTIDPVRTVGVEPTFAAPFTINRLEGGLGYQSRSAV